LWVLGIGSHPPRPFSQEQHLPPPGNPDLVSDPLGRSPSPLKQKSVSLSSPPPPSSPPSRFLVPSITKSPTPPPSSHSLPSILTSNLFPLPCYFLSLRPTHSLPPSIPTFFFPFTPPLLRFHPPSSHHHVLPLTSCPFFPPLSYPHSPSLFLSSTIPTGLRTTSFILPSPLCWDINGSLPLFEG